MHQVDINISLLWKHFFMTIQKIPKMTHKKDDSIDMDKLIWTYHYDLWFFLLIGYEIIWLR
jgi:hypothetical protein